MVDKFADIQNLVLFGLKKKINDSNQIWGQRIPPCMEVLDYCQNGAEITPSRLWSSFWIRTLRCFHVFSLWRQRPVQSML